MTTLEGIDISHWQQGLSIAKANPDFAIMKATDGTSYVDPTCDGFVSQAKAHGALFGVYHFWQGNATAEADWFIKNVKGYIGQGILVLDFEGAHATSASAAKSFLDRVYDKTGVRPLIYMSQSVTRQFDWSAVSKNYALWVARYGSSSYGDTGAWASPAMWQWTSTGKVNGYSGNVDKDHFYGDAKAWAAFASGSASGGGDHTDTDGGGGSLTVPTVSTDGVWGSATTTQRQTILTNMGLYSGVIDGRLDHQNPAWKDSNPGLGSGWGWETSYKGKGGSKTIKADQTRLTKTKGKDGKALYRGSVDGLAGPEYFQALQREQQTPVDGVVSRPSTMVTAMQTDGNKGRLS